MSTVKGKTSSGFEFEVDEAIFDDYEMLELLCDFNSDKSVFPTIARKMLGDEQHKALKEHLRNENGIVQASKIETELSEIFHFATHGSNDAKN